MIVERSFAGLTSDHYTFDPAKRSLSLICASGLLGGFGYHGLRYENSFFAQLFLKLHFKGRILDACILFSACIHKLRLESFYILDFTKIPPKIARQKISFDRKALWYFKINPVA